MAVNECIMMKRKCFGFRKQRPPRIRDDRRYGKYSLTPLFPRKARYRAHIRKHVSENKRQHKGSADAGSED